jgi:DNA-binding transcriptional MerR regulator
MIERLFTQGEVNKIFEHIPTRTTRFWVESGLVEWSSESEDRRGLHREYAIQNLWQQALVEELMSLTTSVKQVKRWMNYANSKIIKKVPDLWNKHILIVRKEDPEVDEKFETGNAPFIGTNSGFHSAQLIKTTEINIITLEDIIKNFGSPVIIMIDLRKIVDKVNNLLKKATL